MKYDEKYIVAQIVVLVLLHNLTPDSSVTELFDWYLYCIQNGCLEYQLNNQGKVTGFLDWVRLKKIPKSMGDALRIFDAYGNKGPIAFAINCVAANQHDFMVMRRKALDKNKDCLAYCYHRKKDDRIFVKRRNDVKEDRNQSNEPLVPMQVR